MNGFLVFLVWLMSAHNQTVLMEMTVDARWGVLENTCKHRANLMPQLIRTISRTGPIDETILKDLQYASDGIPTYKLTAENLDDPKKIERFEHAQERFRNAMIPLMGVAERDPQLRSAASYKGIKEEIEKTEREIIQARNEYNRAAASYNITIAVLPNSLFAGGRKDRRLFEPDY